MKCAVAALKAWLAAGGSAIQRSENDDPKYYGLINSPEWYENETNRLPDFGDFHKYSTLWRNSYKIHKHHGGRPQVVLRRDGLWHPDNSSAELIRKKIMPEGSHWPNASMERACEEAMVAASRDVEEEALEEPHRTTLHGKIWMDIQDENQMLNTIAVPAPDEW